ncbi:hypothetical protein DSECCO2_462210 [anaerobic digester metagenome]
MLPELILNMELQQYFGPLFRYLAKTYKKPASGFYTGIIGIGNICFIVRNQPAIAVNAPEITEIQHILRLSGRIFRIVGVIGFYCNDIIAIMVHKLSYIYNRRKETTVVTVELLPVQPDNGFAHNGLKVQEQFLCLKSFGHFKMLSVPDNTLIIDTPARFFRQHLNAVRKMYNLPGCIGIIRPVGIR